MRKWVPMRSSVSPTFTTLESHLHFHLFCIPISSNHIPTIDHLSHRRHISSRVHRSHENGRQTEMTDEPSSLVWTAYTLINLARRHWLLNTSLTWAQFSQWTLSWAHWIQGGFLTSASGQIWVKNQSRLYKDEMNISGLQNLSSSQILRWNWHRLHTTCCGLYSTNFSDPYTFLQPRNGPTSVSIT